ncbi:hypothetical protein K438DRAFT_769944 [Mycena galopus ATCC 62051]|nr:hypothetical protein K438DRAFT_769944 [Mycena galopus ATCC 62051]
MQHHHQQQQHTFAPLQLKGEIMDLEFTIDTDHRKRRRNRTTQSCLNCHTSKRKCDRKRPCQRCIQLGLTGLCVYEIDDPALRDDPSVDENTRLRNRIAELESLVRELRGKPHPRWADSNFRDGDPNEKWHSRATKCAPLPSLSSSLNSSSALGLSSPTLSGSPTNKRRLSSLSDPTHPSRPPALLPPIKTEMPPDASSPILSGGSSTSNGGSGSPNLYRFSASPGPGGRYFSATDPYGDDGGGGYYSPSSGSNGSESLLNSGLGSAGSNGVGSAPCSCRASPGMAHAYISLSQSLQATLSAARTYTSHGQSGQACVLYRRIAELASMMQ